VIGGGATRIRCRMPVRLALRIALVRIGFAIGRLVGRPARRVVLATSHASSISGNLAFIRAELEQRFQAIHTTVIANRPDTGVPGLVRVALASVRSGYLLARARVFVVDDYFLPMYAITPRPGTVRAQVWHASGAFKKFGYSVLGKRFGKSEDDVAHLPIHTNYDVALVSSMRVAPAYAEAFRQPSSIFSASYGIPRTDLFFDVERRAALEQSVRGRYALPAGARVVLYAPTFRGESIIAARSPGNLDLAMLQRELGSDHVVLLREHPFVRRGRSGDPALSGFVVDASDHSDIDELMLVSDVLVTDYSSAMYEFSLLGRPMAFFAPDFEAYEAERGLYFDYVSGVPGPVFETTEDLARWLRAGKFDLDRVTSFRADSFDVADGHASERFVDEIIVPALR
jgi:CDP-glycerol glycerophosphotransferase (TagB/SpsB family)